MELKIPIQFDEDKLKEIVEEAVKRLKAEGYIWRNEPQPFDWSKWTNRKPENYTSIEIARGEKNGK